MLLAQRLAIGLERHEHIVQRLFHRDRAAIAGRIGALDIDPLVLQITRRPQARFLQQGAQRHAGILHVVDHAMGELRPVQLGSGPFHAGIGRAFTEIHVIFARKALQIGIGKHQRRVHKPIDHQPVIFFLQLDRTRMVALERTALRRDRPVQRMDRREVDRTDRVRRQPLHVAPHHVAFELDGQTIGGGIHTFARGLRPVLHLLDHRITTRRGGRARGHGPRPGGRRSRQELAARGLCALQAFCHLAMPPRYVGLSGAGRGITRPPLSQCRAGSRPPCPACGYGFPPRPRSAAPRCPR